MKMLQGRSEIFEFFRQNQTPIYYVSTSTFNVIGLDSWINKLNFINTIDSFAGQHPHVFVSIPPSDIYLPGIESANNYLLSHAAVRDYIRPSESDVGLLFMMFDEETETLAQKLGVSVVSPDVSLRQHLDSKISTTRLAEQAGVASIPNVIARVDSYCTLREVSQELGNELVVQLPYGDSGATTFFISSEADYQLYAEHIAEHPEVKVMKRIRCRQTAIEGCVTRYGTLVGPLMTELIGFKELTPHAGGWCGNEVFCAGTSDFISQDIRQQAQEATLRMGEQLRCEGYWGTFGLDFLVDQDTGILYLGEMNPRITGTTALTSRVALDQHELPLMFFHLLEWFGVDYDYDIEQFNQRWVTADETTSWSQLIIDHIKADCTTILNPPQSGIWRMQDDGTPIFSRPSFYPETVADESEAYFIRTIDPNHTTYKGWSIGRLMMRGRAITDDYQLTERSQKWTNGFRKLFEL